MTAKLIVTCHAVLALSGCCWLAKRDCFPACPPPQLVEVVKPCELPEAVTLESFMRTECADPKLICYSAPEAAKIAANIDRLKTWIIQTRVRCGPPASAPSSNPR